jgi:hypothetical protein
MWNWRNGEALSRYARSFSRTWHKRVKLLLSKLKLLPVKPHTEEWKHEKEPRYSQESLNHWGSQAVWKNSTWKQNQNNHQEGILKCTNLKSSDRLQRLLPAVSRQITTKVIWKVKTKFLLRTCKVEGVVGGIPTSTVETWRQEASNLLQPRGLR